MSAWDAAFEEVMVNGGECGNVGAYLRSWRAEKPKPPGKFLVDHGSCRVPAPPRSNGRLPAPERRSAPMTTNDNPLWAERWRQECETAAYHAATLLRLAGRCFSYSAMVELLRSAPRCPEERQAADESFFMRIACEAARHPAESERTPFGDAIAYFQRLAAMGAPKRAMLEGCIAGTLVGVGTGG
jgi:hypothetical protein